MRVDLSSARVVVATPLGHVQPTLLVLFGVILPSLGFFFLVDSTALLSSSFKKDNPHSLAVARRIPPPVEQLF